MFPSRANTFGQSYKEMLTGPVEGAFILWRLSIQACMLTGDQNKIDRQLMALNERTIKFLSRSRSLQSLQTMKVNDGKSKGMGVFDCVLCKMLLRCRSDNGPLRSEMSLGGRDKVRASHPDNQ